MYSCLLVSGRGGGVLGQLDDAAGDSLEFTHVLSALTNNASNLQEDTS
jgi:hypothetical protein